MKLKSTHELDNRIYLSPKLILSVATACAVGVIVTLSVVISLLYIVKPLVEVVFS